VPAPGVTAISSATASATPVAIAAVAQELVGFIWRRWRAAKHACVEPQEPENYDHQSSW
jgi:hypothetical protein